jgi:hypothetical protein
LAPSLLIHARQALVDGFSEEKKATIFNDKLQYEEQSGYFKFYLKKIITTYQVKVYC